MKIIAAVFLALVAIAAALPVDEKAVEIVRSTYEHTPEGGYVSTLETSDGTIKEEQGIIKEVKDEENKPVKVLVVRGSYTYRNPVDGQPISVTYEADEAGFRAESDSIPKAPVSSR